MQSVQNGLTDPETRRALGRAAQRQDFEPFFSCTLTRALTSEKFIFIESPIANNDAQIWYRNHCIMPRSDTPAMHHRASVLLSS
jgi:hypothetical protein